MNQALTTFITAPSHFLPVMESGQIESPSTVCGEHSAALKMQPWCHFITKKKRRGIDEGMMGGVAPC